MDKPAPFYIENCSLYQIMEEDPKIVRKIVSMKQYPQHIQDEIVDTLNSNYESLVIIESPFIKELSFIVKGKKYFSKLESKDSLVTEFNR